MALLRYERRDVGGKLVVQKRGGIGAADAQQPDIGGIGEAKAVIESIAFGGDIAEIGNQIVNDVATVTGKKKGLWGVHGYL